METPMSPVTNPPDQRLGDSLSLKALIAAIISLVVIPSGPLAFVLGMVALIRERHPTTALIAVILGALESALLIAILAQTHGCGPMSIAYEAAAGTTLKSGIFPAMIQFQGNVFCDEDGDGHGEYGFPNEMSGGMPSDEQHRLLPPTFADLHPLINDYHIAVFLPDGSGVVSERAAITDHSPAAIDAREQHWIAYAWPERWGITGNRMFCIDERGVVWCTKPNKEGTAPHWDSALSAGWGSALAPGWEQWKK